MKTRTGFVSNSSSSSFIVRFDKDPTNMDNLREMMGDCTVNPYGYMIDAEKVLETVYRDVMKQSTEKQCILPFETDEWDDRNNAEGLLLELGVYDDSDTYPEYDALVDEVIADMKQYKLELYCRINKITLAEYERNNEFVRKFTYSDECGNFWAAMEHGDVFRNVDHDVISHH